MKDEESTTYYIVTNNSPATLNIDVSISGKTLTGETKMDSDSFYGVPTSGVFIVEAGYKCTSASLKYNVSISGYKDMSQYVDISVKKQSTNALVTINNNSSKQLSVNAFVVGYDSSGSVISINRFYEYIDGNDNEKTNISYNYEEVKVYDEEDGWDYEERYFVPATYKYFVIAHS